MRKGFSMVELLIVIVIIGVLASIAIPRFKESKRLVYVASMKSDLRNIVSAAESFFAEGGTYDGFGPPSQSTGVTLVYAGTLQGWEATASHEAVPSVVCRIERGQVAGTASEPVCN